MGLGGDEDGQSLGRPGIKEKQVFLLLLGGVEEEEEEGTIPTRRPLFFNGPRVYRQSRPPSLDSWDGSRCQ